jgi:hypothetical protein
MGLLIYSSLIGLLSRLCQKSINESWQYLGVSTGDGFFADMAVITAASDCQLPYEDIVIRNCLGGIPPFNYPRIWVILGRLVGISFSDTAPLAIAAIISFLLTYLFIFRKTATTHWLYVTALVCSPVVMLALQRANSDLIIFCFVALSAVFITRQKLFSAVLLLLVASALKLYPIFALFALLNQAKNYLVLLCVGLFCLYCYLTINDLTLIATATPRADSISYGKFVLVDYMNRHFSSMASLTPLALLHTLVSIAAVSLPLIFVFLKKQIDLPLPGLVVAPTFQNTLFLAGAGIYVCTFFIGNNWDYRLIFLHLTTPYLFVIVAEPSSCRPVIRLLLVLILSVSWSNFFATNFLDQTWYRPVRFVFVLLDEVQHWMVYTILCSSLLMYGKNYIFTIIFPKVQPELVR